MQERIFAMGNTAALLTWILLIVLPRWRGVAQALATFVVPTLIAAAYTALIGVYWSRAEGGFGTLAEVYQLFQTPGALLAGWFHYLAFDLFVGAWVARECRREGLPHLVVVPILVMTFLFGPIGYLTSLLVRSAWRIASARGEESRAESVKKSALLDFIEREPTLNAAAFVCFALMVPMALAAAIDDRALGGANVWLKPLKFQVSVGLYLATLAFFMPMAGAGDAFRKSAKGRFVVWGSIFTAGLELLYIGWRASRGEASHFNHTTLATSFLYALMGVGAVTLSAAGPVLAWGVARSDAGGARPAYRLGVVLGLVLGFALGAVGGAVMASGTGHFVGTPPGENPVLPVIGWSRAVGDLRVAHFLGLHSPQIIAMVGALTAALAGRWARALVVVFAACYSALTIGLFVQALAGKPLLPL